MYTTVVLLGLLGVVLLVLAVWVWRRTRPEPELLAPLETMQTRGWRKLDPAAQRRSLDDSRPDGAAPIRRATSAPAVDSSFATVAPVSSFDDLSDSGDGRSEDASDDRDHDLDTTGEILDPVEPDAIVAVDRAGDSPADVRDEGDEAGVADSVGSGDTGELVGDGASLIDDDIDAVEHTDDGGATEVVGAEAGAVRGPLDGDAGDDPAGEGLDDDDGDTDDGDSDDVFGQPPAARPIDPLLPPPQPSADQSS